MISWQCILIWLLQFMISNTWSALLFTMPYCKSFTGMQHQNFWEIFRRFLCNSRWFNNNRWKPFRFFLNGITIIYNMCYNLESEHGGLYIGSRWCNRYLCSFQWLRILWIFMLFCYHHWMSNLKCIGDI